MLGSTTIMYWCSLYGIPMTVKGIAYLYTLLGGATTFVGMRAYDKRSERINVETVVTEDGKRVKVDQLRQQKQQLEAKHFNASQEEEKIKVAKEYEKVEMERKNAAIEAYNLAESEAESVAFKGMKPPKTNALLLGYTQNLQPYWGYFTNYIVAGSTGSRKSRKMHATLLNFLGNKQGTVYIGDFKQIDFKAFKDKKGVAMYIDDIQETKSLIESFKAEYQRRLNLIKAGYDDEEGTHKEYIDIDDYNEKNPKKKQKPYLLVIDEYADLSDTYQDKNKKPIGPYQDLIELARKIRATGGRIILGTQRPSADVVIGTLKNNTQILGMRCLNEINSKIMVDTGGCEKLSPGEALTIEDNKMLKVWNYDLNNEHLESCINKLK